MDSLLIEKLLIYLAKAQGHSANPFALKNPYGQKIKYGYEDFARFLTDIIEEAVKVKMTAVIQYVNPVDLRTLVRRSEQPFLTFGVDEKGHPTPIVLEPALGTRQALAIRFSSYGVYKPEPLRDANIEFYTFGSNYASDKAGKIPLIFFYPIRQAVSSSGVTSTVPDKKPYANKVHPWVRLLRLLGTEKQDIVYIYTFALVIGLINLSLPLGTQAIIGLISGGMVFNSVVILIALVVLGIIAAGGLTIMQMTIVEILQRRIFARAAFEFSYRVPRLSIKNFDADYGPELMNRFFEVANIQKALPKILIELTAAALTIIFGLLLLAFYHPFFVFFGVFLLIFVIVFLAYTAPKGTQTAVMESKYKYKMVAWFENIAHSIFGFKMAGNTLLAVKKTDEIVNHYLYYRKKHFNILIGQYTGALVFKAIVVAGLLILGTILVVNRDITLGQFVASEIVVITVTSAVEKLLLGFETLYDIMVAVDKLGYVTDMPMERAEGIVIDKAHSDKGLEIKVQNLSYKYPKAKVASVKDATFTLKEGDSLAITGEAGSGKHTLVKVLLGLLPDFEGAVSIGGISLRDLDLAHLRQMIGENVIESAVIQGTIYDNIVMGRSNIGPYDVTEVLEALGMNKFINSLPDGLHTHLLIGETGLHQSALYMIGIARALAGKPPLVFIGDEIQQLSQSQKLRILSYLQDPANNWTVIYLTTDPLIQAAAKYVVEMKGGVCQLSENK